MTETRSYSTMKEMGREFNLTSHQIGRHLKALGLRTPDGKPSQLAFDKGLPGKRYHEEHFAWAWAVPETIEILEEAGLERVAKPADDE